MGAGIQRNANPVELKQNIDDEANYIKTWFENFDI